MRSKDARRRGGRVAEGARLESVYTGNRIEGSNPSLSATAQKNLVLCSLTPAAGNAETQHFLASAMHPATGESLNFILRMGDILSTCELAGKSTEVRALRNQWLAELPYNRSWNSCCTSDVAAELATIAGIQFPPFRQAFPKAQIRHIRGRNCLRSAGVFMNLSRCGQHCLITEP